MLFKKVYRPLNLLYIESIHDGVDIDVYNRQVMDIVRLTGRSFASVRAKRRSPLNAAMTKTYRKKMKKKAAKTERVSPWTRWSDDEVEIAMNPNLTLEEKIQKIGRSYSAVASKIGKLKEK